MNDAKDTASVTQVADYLLSLSDEMRRLADLIIDHGGLGADIRQHAKEMHGAADITQGWADEIRAMGHCVQEQN